MATVDLGFAEKCDDCWRLYSHYFPSKLGGPPAWLALTQLPNDSLLCCQGCHEPVKFVLQIYSPDEQNAHAFHRTLFVFACSKTGCSDRSFTCFRGQLKLENKFYSSSPPNDNYFDEKDVYPTVDQFTNTCSVCKCLGTKTCSKCNAFKYCSVAHQRWHWRNGHRQQCSPDVAEQGTSVKGFNFPEYEIVIEPEKSEDERLEIERTESQALLERATISGASTSADPAGWANQKTKIADSQFLRFRERINADPKQIIRYDRGGDPLLVKKETINQDEIPACERCGAPRLFEFQVLPQTLSYLKIESSFSDDTLDWGTLLVYTCSDNCDLTTEDGGGVYAKEYVYCQMLSNEDVVKLDRS